MAVVVTCDLCAEFPGVHKHPVLGDVCVGCWEEYRAYREGKRT